MLIAHLSDFHLYTEKLETSLIRDNIADVIRLIVADLAAFTPSIDVIALTGDLTDKGSAADYAMLRELLSPLSARILAIPGNHDLRSNFREAFSDILPFADPLTSQYATIVDGIRFLALDTVIENHVGGQLRPQSLDWLEEQLAKPYAGQTTILMHHPPHTSGLTFFDNIALVDGVERFGQLVARQNGRTTILCGHIHRPTQAMWNGAWVAVAGSPAFQTALDLHPHDVEPTVDDIPYAYFIYRMTGNSGFSVHPRYVKLP